MDSQFNWLGDKKIGACDLILKELLPLARHGLELQKVDTADIDKYLGIIEARATEHMTGARWQLRAFTKLKNTITRDEALAVLTSSIVNNQEKEIPVHLWKLPDPADFGRIQTIQTEGGRVHGNRFVYGPAGRLGRSGNRDDGLEEDTIYAPSKTKKGNWLD
ncbi:MAG: hypothetical protein R2769_00230 [Saprospiraceae bacterium]